MDTNEIKSHIAASVLLFSIILLAAWVWESAIKQSSNHYSKEYSNAPN